MSDNPLVADAVDMSTPFSGAFVLEDIEGLVTSIQNNDWLGGTLSGVALAADTVAAVSDPIGSLIAHGLGWLLEHMEPLRGWFNDLAGDPGEVAGYAQTWANISQALSGSASDLQLLVRELDDLEGQTIEAYRRFQADAAKHLEGASELADGISAGMELASMAVKIVHDLARDALAELVGTAISAALELTVTLGFAAPLVVEQVATKAFSLVARVGKTITRLLRSMKDFGGLIARAHKALQTLWELFQKALKGADGTPPRTPDGPTTPRSPESPDTPSAPDTPSGTPDGPSGGTAGGDAPPSGGVPTPPGSVIPDPPVSTKPDSPSVDGSTDGALPDGSTPDADGTPDVGDADGTPSTPPPDMPDLSAIDSQFRDPVTGEIPLAVRDEWAQAVSEAYPTLTPTDVKALYGYTTNDFYAEMNAGLRNGDTLDPALQARVDEISAALAKLPDNAVTTYRGVDGMSPADLGMVEGQPWSDPAFTSASSSPGGAFPGETQITIEGATGHDINAISRYPHEGELMYDRDTEFEVVSITTTGSGDSAVYSVVLREK